MIRKYCFTIIILMTSWQINGQTWTRQLDGPSVPPLVWASSIFDGQDILQTSDGNYVMAGVSSYATGAIRDYPSLIKLDQTGATLWEKSYYSDNADVAAFSNVSLVTMPNDELLLGGVNFNRPHLIRIDALGDTILTEDYGSYCGLLGAGIPCVTNDLKLRKTKDGHYLMMVTSRATVGVAFVYNTQLSKLEQDGSVLWSKNYLNTGAEDVQPTIDSGYIMVGRNNFNAPILYKVDAMGDSSWRVLNQGSLPISTFHSVVQAPDSGYVVTTELQGFIGLTPMISKMNASGAAQWSTTSLGGTLGGINGFAHQVIYDPNGYYLVTGFVQRANQVSTILDEAAFVAKIDLNGNVLVEETFEDSIRNKGNVLQPTTDGGYIMVGDYDDRQGYVVKIDSGLTVLSIEHLVMEEMVDINVFPNPFEHQTTFEIKDANYTDFEVHIFDGLGREVKAIRSNNTGQAILSKEHLNSGVYWFKLIADRKIIGSGKLVVK